MTTAAMTATRSPGDRLDTVTWLVLAGFVAALQFSIAGSQLLLAVVLLAWSVLVVSRHETVSVPRIFWPLCAYAAVTLVSAAFSRDPVASFIDCKQLVLFLIVPAVYRLTRGHRADVLLTVIISVGALSALVGVFQYGILHYDNLGRRPQGTLTHYMTYSGILMLTLCAATARLLFRKGERGDWVWPALVMPVLVVALALTFTRSAWVGACAGVALLLVMKDRRLIALMPVVVAVFIALAPQGVLDRAYSMFDLNDPTNRDRIAMLKSGARMVADHPLVGVGPNMVKEVYAAYRDPGAVEALNLHLHNVPMQIAAERGLPALAVWLWFIGMAAVDLVRRLGSNRTRSLAAAGLAALVAMLCAGLFEYNFGDSEFMMLLLVLLTLPYSAELADGATPS